MSHVVDNSLSASRDVAAAGGRLPDFVVIGAMKAGTTTLHRYLAMHSRVFMSTPKEPGYFSRDDQYARGIEWYRGLFADAGADQLCGEASTCYSRCWRYPQAATRLAQAIPDARLIYLMRHPVDRVYSHYGHEMRVRYRKQALKPISLERFLQEDLEAIDASLYMRQIDRYLEHFPREQMLFLLTEDLQEQPGQVLECVEAFLGLPPQNLSDSEPIVANRPVDTFAARAESLRKTERLRRSVFGRIMAGLMPASWRGPARRLVAKCLKNSTVGRQAIDSFHMDEMSPAVRRQLIERFDGPTRELEQFLGRDLSHWRQ